MGAKQHLKRLRPRAVLFEHQGKEAMPYGSLGSLFNEIHYKVFGIKKHLTKFRLVPIREASDCLYNDYVAIDQAV